MLKKSVKMQTVYILERKTTVFVFFVIIGFIAVNFIMNMISNYEISEVNQMLDPIKMTILSDWNILSYYFLAYYPLIVVIPTAMLFLTDKNSGMDIYIKSRVGNVNYMRGKLVSVYLVTFLLFTIPFFMELLLDFLCYSQYSNGDPSHYEYVNMISDGIYSNYFLFELYKINKYLYAIVNILIFGAVSAVLAGFNYIVASFRIFKFKIFTFFPIYILFYFITLVSNFLNFSFSTDYMLILEMFGLSKNERNDFAYAIFLIFICIISWILLEIQIRRKNTI